MRISLFGTGYVGAVTAACLSDDGHSVIAVDVNPEKVAMINRGQAPIVEPGLPEMLRKGIDCGLLRATTDAASAIAETELSLICVGTPSNAIGDLDLSHVIGVSEEIGSALAGRNEPHTLVYRSTMLPGSMANTVRPALMRGMGGSLGPVSLAYYPEFLRESTAIQDYREPGAIVIGVEDEFALQQLREINSKIASQEIVVDIQTAEAIKYVNNCWHACKISFANEIGSICRSTGIDSHAVMETVCADTRLNISTAYMRPGMAFGGSCLPKDLRALRRHASQLGVSTPMLNGIAAANEDQITRAFDMIVQAGGKKIALLGLSFKEETDDLRESPLVALAERLHGKGYALKIVDRNVRFAALTGANLSHVRAHLPHLADLICDDLDSAIDDCDVVVVGQKTEEFVSAVGRTRREKPVVDLVRVRRDRVSDGGAYAGLCW